MIRRPPRSTLDRSSAASDVYKRQEQKRAQDRARLAAMLRYSQSHLCLTRLLVTYFGYTDHPACGTCDNFVRAAKSAPPSAREIETVAATLAARRSGDPATRRALLEEALRRNRGAGRGRALKIERVKRPVCLLYTSPSP